MTSSSPPFCDFLLAKAELVSQELDRLFPLKDVPYSKLYEGARYSLLAPGKRLRPIFTLLVAGSLGVDEAVALQPACALEAVHTYSLIHDDLPCMDDDDLRRGRPTLHKVLPEGHAVLVGDFLLTRSFGLIAEAPGLDANQKVELIGCLSRLSGDGGMIAGQVLDLEAEGSKEISGSDLQEIHEKKTGAMLVASVDFACIMAKCDDETRTSLCKIAKDLGLAFQIVDDVLDLTQSSEELGKPAGSDCASEKSTFPRLYGLEKSKKMAESLLNDSLLALEKLPYPTASLESLAKYLVKRKH